MLKTDKMRVRKSSFPKRMQEAISEYKRATGDKDVLESVELFLNLKVLLHSTQLTQPTVAVLRLAQQTVREMAREAQKFPEAFEQFELESVYPANLQYITRARAVEIFVEDVKSFLKTLNTKDYDVFATHWGLDGIPATTAVNIGKRYGVTRQRASALVGVLTERFQDSMRISPECFWQEMVRPVITDGVERALADIRDLFPTDRMFHKFISAVCNHKEAASKFKMQLSTGELGEIFSMHGKKVDRNVFAKEVQKMMPSIKAGDADFVLYRGREIGFLDFDYKWVYPKRIYKRQAVAAILHDYPKGLSWKKAGKLANEWGVMSAPIRFSRFEVLAFIDSPFVVNSHVDGKQVFIHIRFAEYDGSENDRVFDLLTEFLGKQPKKTGHLFMFFIDYQKNLPKELSYDILRHYVLFYGEERGIYFSGMRQKEAVSLNKEFDPKPINQLYVIRRKIKMAKKPISRQHLVRYIRSGNVLQVDNIIRELIAKNEVQRVSAGLYTST